MAKSYPTDPSAPDVPTKAAPPPTKEDTRAIVVFFDGPFQGEASVLPAGAEPYGNELHIPHASGLCIYTLTDPVTVGAVPGVEKVPGYRLQRQEPAYAPTPTPADPPPPDPPPLPDDQRVLHDGPFDGQTRKQVLGAVLHANGSELHVPTTGAIAIYQRDSAAPLAAWRYARREPVYRT